MSASMPGIMQRQPHVVDGLRGPEHAPDAGLTFTSVVLPEVQPGQRMFRARYRRLRLHLGKRPDKFDNASGTKVPGFEFTAVFDEYMLVLPTYFRSRAIPESEQAEFLRRLETHQAKGKDYEDVAILREQVAQEEENTAREILERYPKLRQKLAAEAAQEGGFKLPGKK